MTAASTHHAAYNGPATEPDIAAFLAADWDAHSSPRRQTDIHPYPARYIPELPAMALEALRPRGPVLDPFCGSGTTLLEALRIGLPTVGVDINPIACLITRVKTTRWTGNRDSDLLNEHLRGLVECARRGDVDPQTFEQIPRLDHWFEPWAQQLLGGAITYARQLDTENPWRDRVALAISASTVRVGRQESDTRYAAVDKRLDAQQALRVLADALRRIARWCEDNAPGESSPRARVIQGDARSLTDLADGSVAAAVFSPPYPNAYEYWLYHKYRMYWLGFDPLAVRGAEIGARPFYSGSGKATRSDFEREMSEVFAELHRVLASGGAAIAVVGDSIIRGEFVDNSEVLASAAKESGFSLAAATFRSIRRSSASFNSDHARARQGEHVLLFTREE